MILLHFFGLGDVLRRFELEQLTGLNLMGFRPLNLDDLVIWSQEVALQHQWDADRIHHDVLRRERRHGNHHRTALREPSLTDSKPT